MLVNWNEYLARYQKARGGWFFGGEDWDCDAQLVLPREGKHPLLVNVFDANSGRAEVPALRGRTMVKLERDFRLHIRAKGLVGGGVSGVAGLLGRDMDFGYPEALGGRMVTTSDRAFAKLVLGSLELRNGLAGRKKEYLRVCPSLLGEGWHTVEAGPASLEGAVQGASPWVNEAMQQSGSGLDAEEAYQAAYPHFEEQMDEFLALLRSAADALTRWPMPAASGDKR